MKVVLTQDVPKVGDLGTIQDVRDGFARNFLIPQGLARIATPGMIRQVEERQESERRRIAQLEEDMRDLAGQIDGVRLEIHARVGEQGRLFGSVTSADIAERLTEITGQEVDRRKVELEAPIREIGEFTVPVRLVGKLVPEITVAVFDPSAPMLAESLAEDVDEDTEVYEFEVEGIDAVTGEIADAEQMLQAADDTAPAASAETEVDEEESAEVEAEKEKEST